MTAELSRRAALGVIAGLAALPAFAGAAFAQSRTAVSAIEVDVSPLRRQGAGVFADIVQSALRRELAAVYTISSGGPRLVVRIDSFFLNSSLGDSDFDFSRAQIPNFDSMTGVNRLVARDGSVVAEYPLHSTTRSDAAGSMWREGIERDRAVLISRDYAHWVARRF
ncbi:MAG: hypothetical protein EA385_03885 [Salinarimonadaceae bacterium]|nr:MAG: hypothetical protein EA385_03885 [Salinarimonadaceae bacterium]